MKSSHKISAQVQDDSQTVAPVKRGSNNFNNEQNSGAVGAAGGDNGASALRELRKKNGSSAKQK